MFPYWGNNALVYILWQAHQQRTGPLLNKQRFWASLPWFLSIKGLTIQPLPRTENFQMLMVSFLLEFFSLGHIWAQGWWSPSLWQLCILVSVMDFFYLYQKKKIRMPSRHASNSSSHLSHLDTLLKGPWCWQTCSAKLKVYSRQNREASADDVILRHTNPHTEWVLQNQFPPHTVNRICLQKATLSRHCLLLKCL